jgi:hypothetical protein
VDLSAYRIIQEALTNVVRHAGTGASCVVHVGYTDADLVIRVTDDGGLSVVLPSVSVANAGTGHGIIGMRERVHLCGGTFSAGPLPNGGFQVTATLPLPPAELRAWAGPRAGDGIRAEDGIGAGSRTTADVSAPATLNGAPAATGVVTWGGAGRG